MDSIIFIKKMRNVNNAIIVFGVLFLVFSTGCRAQEITYENVKFIKDNEINSSNFKQIGYRYIVAFKNVWDDRRGKQAIKIPIYKGINGDVLLSQLEKKQKQKQKDVSILGSLIIETGKGKVKKGILDCVNFYKKTLLKDIDINKPTVIGVESSGLFIWYDFNYEGLSSSLMIATAIDENCNKSNFKYIQDIEVSRKFDGFTLSIRLGESSGFQGNDLTPNF